MTAVLALLAGNPVPPSGGVSKALTTSAENKGSAVSSLTVTLSFASAGDVVILMSFNTTVGTAQTVSGAASSHITWTKRTSLTWTNTSGSTGKDNMEIWWGHVTGSITSEVVTVTYTGTIDGAALNIFGISGCAVPTAPWDTNGACSGTWHITTNGSNTVQTISGISTDSTVPMVICMMGSSDQNVNGITKPSGFNQIQDEFNTTGTNFSTCASFYDLLAAAESSASFTFTGTFSNNGTIIDNLA